MRTRANKVWTWMMQRCTNPRNKDYRHYGARGITVCERWRDYANFLADMGDPPLGMSLDRINNDGPYSPDNCQWATQKQQVRNTRHNLMVEYQGRRMCLSAAAELAGVNYFTAHSRITRLGQTPDQALRKRAAAQ